MGLLNKIYGLVQAKRCLFNIICANRFEQSEADRRVFRTFDDGEVEMVVFVHVDDIPAHAKNQSMMSVVDEFGVEKARRTAVCLGVPTLS